MTTKTIKTEHSFLANVKLTMSVLCLTLIFASGTYATTYYINYEAANDSGSGTSKATAWKRHPYMRGFAGTYNNHQAGDRFIFKGGVSWLNACFPLKMEEGGSSESVQDYYGIDESWFTGSEWARPVFDLQNMLVDPTTDLNEVVIFPITGHVTLDNFEFVNYYWDATCNRRAVAMVAGYDYAEGMVKNCYFHAWHHDTLANGCHDDVAVVSWGAEVDNCIFDGAPDMDSGCATCVWRVRNTTVRNMPNGIIPIWKAEDPADYSRNLVVSNCTVGPIMPSFDPDAHENGLEPTSSHDLYISGCTFFDVREGVCILVSSLNDVRGNTEHLFMWNNVFHTETMFHATYAVNPSIQEYGYFYQNTVAGKHDGDTSIANSIRWGAGGGTAAVLDARGNHMINSQIWTDSTATVQLSAPNQSETYIQAAAHGCTLANLYKPVISSPGASIPYMGAVDWVTGHAYVKNDKVTQPGSYDLYIAKQPHTSGDSNEPGSGASWTTYWAQLENFGKDRNGVVRTTWNAGAYEFASGPLGSPTTTRTITSTGTITPTNTITRTRTITPTRTSSITATPTSTETRVVTSTQTRTITRTNTITPTRTQTPVLTATPTFTQTSIVSPPPSRTFTSTRTASSTRTLTRTLTPTRTRTPIRSVVPTSTQTPLLSHTPIQTPTATPRILEWSEKAISIFPNPAAGLSVSIQFQAENAGPAEVVVHNVAGRLVSRRDISIASPGQQTVQYRVDKLVNGVYVVTIRQAGKSLGIKRLVVKRAGK